MRKSGRPGGSGAGATYVGRLRSPEVGRLGRAQVARHGPVRRVPAWPAKSEAPGVAGGFMTSSLCPVCYLRSSIFMVRVSSSRLRR